MPIHAVFQHASALRLHPETLFYFVIFVFVLIAGEGWSPCRPLPRPPPPHLAWPAPRPRRLARCARPSAVGRLCQSVVSSPRLPSWGAPIPARPRADCDKALRSSEWSGTCRPARMFVRSPPLSPWPAAAPRQPVGCHPACKVGDSDRLCLPSCRPPGAERERRGGGPRAPRRHCRAGAGAPGCGRWAAPVQGMAGARTLPRRRRPTMANCAPAFRSGTPRRWCAAGSARWSRSSGHLHPRCRGRR